MLTNDAEVSQIEELDAPLGSPDRVRRLRRALDEKSSSCSVVSVGASLFGGGQVTPPPPLERTPAALRIRPTGRQRAGPPGAVRGTDSDMGSERSTGWGAGDLERAYGDFESFKQAMVSFENHHWLKRPLQWQQWLSIAHRLQKCYPGQGPPPGMQNSSAWKQFRSAVQKEAGWSPKKKGWWETFPRRHRS